MSTAAVRARGRPARFPDRRHDVLRVAARIFSRKGFRQATLSDIAEALDMTRPALYYYAESKDELLAQCAEVARLQLDAALAQAQKNETGLAQVRQWFVTYAEIVCDDFGRCFVLTDRSEMDAAEGERNRQRQLRLGRAVAHMIRKGIKDGSIRSCDPVYASLALFGVFNSMARWFKPEANRTVKRTSMSLLDVAFGGIAAR